MTTIKNLLMVYHSEGGETQKLAQSIIKGIKMQTVPTLNISIQDSINVKANKVLEADAVILGTSENFGYMAGAMKHFFDRIYYPCLEKKRGLPYALFVRAGNDGSGAVASIEKIALGLAWRRISTPLIFSGEITRFDLLKCEEFGATIATGLEVGIF